MTDCFRCGEEIGDVHRPTAELTITGGRLERKYAGGVTLCFLCAEAIDDHLKSGEGPEKITEPSIGE